MKNIVPTLLLVGGIAIILFGTMRKDEGQADIDLGATEISIGKSDASFWPYFIVGGVAAAAGLVMLVKGRK
ncbi:MAG: DUF3185 family protein [Flavobacteriales bacterium]|nr:DUF3185 family protein [Flavobacteriales bacterium]MCB9178640.1 DUF3185 family protein [Flavobacteriales bacterium]